MRSGGDPGILGNGVDGRAAFKHLEAICRHRHRLGRFIEAMIGTSNSLQQPRTPFRCTDIDHQIDVAPIDAKIQRRCANYRAQLAGGHRVFDASSLRNIKGAVMKCDGEIIVVGLPQFLKETPPGCAY